MKKRWLTIATTISACGVIAVVIAQPPGPRMHRITERGELRLVPATSSPESQSEVTIEIVGEDRVIKSNGIPNHQTGRFPNRGNPHRISAQTNVYRVPANPELADSTTPLQGRFGVAINGVPFDPGAAEFYEGAGDWQYEALSGAIQLGIDVSHAHVQPDGNYHYHGLPTGLLDAVKLAPGKHSPLIGWAADGFPIYAVYGYADPKDVNSPIQKLTSSYRLKRGDRPGGNEPGGTYDGTFVADYEYVEGGGDLDECNGRFTVTPDFPDGTYAYYMTESWPVVPRLFRGTPSADFRHGAPGGPGRPGGPGMRPADRGRADRGRRNSGGGDSGGGDSGGGDSDGGRQAGPGGSNRPGGAGFEGRPRPGQILPPFLVDSLRLNAQQREELAALQRHVDEALAEILTPAQREQLDRPPRFGPPGPGGRGPGIGPPGGRGGPPGSGPPARRPGQRPARDENSQSER